ncbi:hypothetical protein MoryE10_11660 [Methylogaea oryzae]|uniref:EAL domain-containing protein n=2 Tax=Methylogaea oryzae TaxID=1295382 RepID=A0A8D5ALX5_9GAMM|nr:hypothetical protein MoryE10_11660 [Methylogaea oryzae]
MDTELDYLRTHVIAEHAEILEAVVRLRDHAAHAHRMLKETALAMKTQESPNNAKDDIDSGRRAVPDDIAQHFLRTSIGYEHLWKVRDRCAKKMIAAMRNSMIAHNNLVSDYKTAVTANDLLERQRRVLESIILAQDRNISCREFFFSVLGSFSKEFDFACFFVAMMDSDNIGVELYYPKRYPDSVTSELRRNCVAELLATLKLPRIPPYVINDFFLDSSQASVIPLPKQIVTVAVPAKTQEETGILGLSYVACQEHSYHETRVIESLLSVLSMAAVYCHRITNKIDELQFYAIHDPLTQLYNRRHFNEILSYEIGRAERHQHTFAVLIIDLDNFKDINDSFGHQTGDSALIGIAETLRASLRNGDLAARIGGDEFAVILPETENDGAEIVGEKICAAISRKKFTACGKHFSITASIGLAAFPNNGNTSESLLASADIAMYKAKSSGKNALYQVKQNEIQDRHILLNNLEEIKLALDQDRIVPFFQPIVASSTGDILGYETLARIIEQDGAIKPAACFIDTIERYGLARRLDYIIVRKSIEALGQHVANGGRLVKLFINLSAQELQGRSVISYADHLCQDFNIPRDCIVFEITERAAIQDIGRMRQFLSRLRNKGFSFALDDFGCGYNSFHYLRDLHFEYVKIDGEFVKNIRRTTIDHALVECLSNLCAKIGTKTIGEYIENADILQEINLLNVDFAQGFYVGLPENGFLYKNVIGAIAA